jgi:nicotinamide mononucleotide (NMN) deamidase PncC
MPLIKQDILRTNKRYVTKIVASGVPTSTAESITLGLTASAFLDAEGITAVKLHSVMSTANAAAVAGWYWTARWGNTYTGGTYGQNAGDCLFATGVDTELFFEPRFSHSRTGVKAQLESGTITISLDNSGNEFSTANGTIILEFTI